jgi:hypothetical protein
MASDAGRLTLELETPTPAAAKDLSPAYEPDDPHQELDRGAADFVDGAA